MNILMICYYYPPLMDVGSKRSVAFSVNFKKHGWQPYVISVRNPDKHYCTVGKDAPPAGIAVEYTYSVCNVYHILGKLHGILARVLRLAKIHLGRNYLLDIVCIPDIFFGWIPLTVVKGIRSIRKNAVDVIYVSCSPFSSAIIGILLKKLSGKPLVVDFRDPFALNELSMIFETPAWRAKWNRATEAWVIKAADLFIVNTEEVKTAYIAQYPVSRGKIHAVTNGFDYRFLVDEELAKFEKFTVIYAGLFYFFDKRNDMHTDAFFSGLSVLKRRNQISRENFQFLYFGEDRLKFGEIGRRFSIEDLLVCGPRKPYAEILQDIKRSHLQLLRISKPMISTKLFEGIALNIPFLATIPEGEVEELVRKYSPASYVITEYSPEKIADAILDVQNRYQSGEMVPNRIEAFRKNYSRESLTLTLMKIIQGNLSVSMLAERQ